MNKIIVWLKACRLKLHILGMLPVLVGSLIAFSETGNFNLVNLIFAGLITIFILIATAFANDYSDVETDKINKNFNMFSGGSRSIADGRISKREMPIATVIVSFLAIILSVIFLLSLKGRPLILILSLTGLFIGTEYSLPPLKINYRGFGELFVVAMYSIFSIFFGYVTQNGFGFDKNILYFSVPIGIAMFLIILITEVPDLESDKLSGKKTIPTILGREASLNIYVLGVMSFYLAALILFVSSAINRFIFFGLLFSLPVGVYMAKSKNITNLCGATVFFNVWVNAVLVLNLI